MKQHFFSFLLILLLCMTGATAFAHDISMKNSDGVTIYYVWTNNKTELAVSFRGNSYSYYSNEYSGNVSIPASVNYNGSIYSVTSIGNSAFSGCTGLTSVTIPNSVTSIGDWAFYGCSGLTSVTIPSSVTSIGDCAFRDCSSLTSVTIPNSVTSIGISAFAGCSGLTSVTIPNSVTSIGNSAFFNCSGLNSITIPNSVTSLGGGAFSGCSSLTSVTIPNSVTSIEECVFLGCNGLTSVTIPNSVTSIGNEAFRGCSGLTSVTIPSSVTSIGGGAFNNTNLKKTIWLTNTPPTGYTNAAGAVNYVANDQYTSLNNKTVYPFLSSMFEVDGVKYVPVSPSERTCDAIDCVFDSTTTHFKILPTVTYRGVTLNVLSIKPYICYQNKFIEDVELRNGGVIPDYAFQQCSNMETITLDDNYTSIGKYAFESCSKLQGIEIPDSTESIGAYAFSGCSKMSKVILGQSVKVIDKYAFSSCESLPKITIPQATTNIQDYVFSGCKSLKIVLLANSEKELKLGSNDNNPMFSDCPLDAIYIGRNITYPTASNKGYSPFYRNTTLRTVIITDKETEISTNEFYGCTNLWKVRIGDGVTTIGDWAFSGCSSLEYFGFGTSVETIGKEAFSDCSAVKRLVSKAATPPVCNDQALDDINKWNCTLYVPEGYVSAYQQADQWKEFFFMEEGVSEIFIPLDTGDVNGDDNIDVADIATVIDVMTGSNVDNKEAADVNEDGVVDVADIACIIDKMCVYEMLDD